MIEESLCPVARTRCVSWLVTQTVWDDLSGRGDMEEEEEEKFQQVLDQILLFVCRHLHPYKLALHSFPTFQVFRHSWSFTRVQPGQPGHSGHLSH